MADEKRKRGRPQKPKTEALTEEYKTRFTKADAERLDRFCKQHGQTQAETIRQATLEKLDRNE